MLLVRLTKKPLSDAMLAILVEEYEEPIQVVQRKPLKMELAQDGVTKRDLFVWLDVLEVDVVEVEGIRCATWMAILREVVGGHETIMAQRNRNGKFVRYLRLTDEGWVSL